MSVLSNRAASSPVISAGAAVSLQMVSVKYRDTHTQTCIHAPFISFLPIKGEKSTW